VLVSSLIPNLDTDRLRLRPFTLSDAAAVHTLAGAREVATTTLNIPHPYPEGTAETWIDGHAAAAAAGTGYIWAMVRKADELLMGGISLWVNATHQRGELGYWLGVPFWNQGYTTEAARRVVEFGFTELGLHRIQAGCFPRNVASARVMEKAGLIYEGLLRGYVRKEDRFEDVAMYALVRTEGQ
jgi:ribosomal-protein-alanine N-acetyltransferase